MIPHTLLLLLVLLPQAQTANPPLPELKTFLNEFQVKRPGLYKALGAWGLADNKFRGKYTYTEICTSYGLDSNGKIKSEDRNVYEVIPDSGPLALYRRQTVKNGKPLTEKQLEKQDREFREQSQEVSDRIQKAAEKAKTKPKPEPPKDAPPPKPTPEPVSIFLTVFDFEIIRRESVDGYPVILLNFKPKVGIKSNDDMGRFLVHMQGKAWVSEEDYELVRIEVDVFEPISFGAGVLAKVQKGSRASMEWRKINDEIWLPYHREATANIRILLLKGWRESQVTEFSNFKKYVVETELKFGDTVEEK